MPPDERHAYTPAELDAMYREHPVTAIRVTGHELFRWESYQRWVDGAARDFRRARSGGDLPHAGGYICVDAAGYVCEIGKHFMAARDAGRFPVRVMRLAEA
jgi:hypothetical protein